MWLFDIWKLWWNNWYVNMKIWLRMYMIVKVLLWNYDDNGFVNIYTSIVCVWCNSMGIIGRFYGGVILVYVMDYGFK